MTETTKTTMRRVLAGVTLAGVLTLPLGGIAAASDGGRDRVPTAPGGQASGAGVRSSDAPKKDSEKAAPTTVAGLKARCTEQINRRLTDLDRLAARVAERADVLTDAHEAAIATIITDAKAGLLVLRGEIDAAATLDALKPLCSRVVTDFRIYALRIPQVNIVLAVDAIGAKQAMFATLRDKLVAAIAVGTTPDNSSPLAALLAEFDAHVLAMVAAADGVADPALAKTVADYNTNPKVLKPFVEAMRTARSEAKGAAKSARSILRLLSDDDDHHTEHPIPTTTAPSA